MIYVVLSLSLSVSLSLSLSIDRTLLATNPGRSNLTDKFDSTREARFLPSCRPTHIHPAYSIIFARLSIDTMRCERCSHVPPPCFIINRHHKSHAVLGAKLCRYCLSLWLSVAAS
uniref:Putative secreted protein n=1 Tax=Anopheles darlingi TaxID=43151 RepID=A0A2M4DCZ9_ANODA